MARPSELELEVARDVRARARRRGTISVLVSPSAASFGPSKNLNPSPPGRRCTLAGARSLAGQVCCSGSAEVRVQDHEGQARKGRSRATEQGEGARMSSELESDGAKVANLTSFAPPSLSAAAGAVHRARGPALLTQAEQSKCTLREPQRTRVCAREVKLESFLTPHRNCFDHDPFRVNVRCNLPIGYCS